MFDLTFVKAHLKNVKLDVTLNDRVRGLVDDERCLSDTLSILIGLHHQPCRRVADTLEACE